MLRRLIVAGLALGLAAPVFVLTQPASAAILLTCTTVSGTSTLTPGLSHNQTAQSDVDTSATFSGCSGTLGKTGGTAVTGSPATPNTTHSFPPRPLGCPTALGGAGPDYADQTPVLISSDPGFEITWSGGGGGNSTGVTKVKSNGPLNPGTVRTVLVVTGGSVNPTPPAGQKNKIKGKLNFTPTGSFTCADDSDPIDTVTIANNGSFIWQQA
jgi:hypothetical protein